MNKIRTITLVISILLIICNIKEGKSSPFRNRDVSLSQTDEEQEKKCEKTTRHESLKSPTRCDCPCCLSGVTDPSKRCSNCKKTSTDKIITNDCKLVKCPSVECKCDEVKVKIGCCHTCKKKKDDKTNNHSNLSDSPTKCNEKNDHNHHEVDCRLVDCAQTVCSKNQVRVRKGCCDICVENKDHEQQEIDCSLVLCAEAKCKSGEKLITHKCCPICVPIEKDKGCIKNKQDSEDCSTKICPLPLCIQGYELTPRNSKYGCCPTCIPQEEYNREFNQNNHKPLDNCAAVSCLVKECGPRETTIIKNCCPICVPKDQNDGCTSKHQTPNDCSNISCPELLCKKGYVLTPRGSIYGCCPKCIPQAEYDREFKNHHQGPNDCSQVNCGIVPPPNKCEDDEILEFSGPNGCCPRCVKKDGHNNGNKKSKNCKCKKYFEQPTICQRIRVKCVVPTCKDDEIEVPFGSSENECCPTCIKKNLCRKGFQTHSHSTIESSEEKKKRKNKEDCKNKKNNRQNSSSGHSKEIKNRHLDQKCDGLECKTKQNVKHENVRTEHECALYTKQPSICNQVKFECNDPVCQENERVVPYGGGKYGCCSTCLHKNKCKERSKSCSHCSSESSEERRRKNYKCDGPDCKSKKNRTSNSKDCSKETKDLKNPDHNKECDGTNCKSKNKFYHNASSHAKESNKDFKINRRERKSKYVRQYTFKKSYGSRELKDRPVYSRGCKCKKCTEQRTIKIIQRKPQDDKPQESKKDCSKVICATPECKHNEKLLPIGPNRCCPICVEEEIIIHGPNCKCKNCSPTQTPHKNCSDVKCNMVPECNNPGEVLSCKIEKYNCCQKCIKKEEYEIYCKSQIKEEHGPSCTCKDCTITEFKPHFNCSHVFCFSKPTCEPGKILSCQCEKYGCCKTCISLDEYNLHCKGVPHEPNCKCQECTKPIQHVDNQEECHECKNEPEVIPCNDCEEYEIVEEPCQECQECPEYSKNTQFDYTQLLL